MLKIALLGTAALVSTAAIAQTSPTAPQTAPSAPATAADTAMPAPEQPMAATDSAPAAQPQVAAQAAPQSATGGQVAQIVESEFSGYDKNSDGKLDKAEFSTWMVALKSKSDPATKSDSPTTVAWVGKAFTQADVDKNKGVSKPELTTFLSQGAE